MTHKEKAQELFDSYYAIISKGNVVENEFKELIGYSEVAKKCAIKSIDVAMFEAKMFDEYYISETSNTEDKRTDYLQKVKEEIEKIK